MDLRTARRPTRLPSWPQDNVVDLRHPAVQDVHDRCELAQQLDLHEAVRPGLLDQSAGHEATEREVHVWAAVCLVPLRHPHVGQRFAIQQATRALRKDVATS